MNLLTAFLLGTNIYIVQNIASLKIRVYSDQKLIIEAPMIIGKEELGENGNNYKSYLGAYTIKEWKKFYVDQKEEYLAWNALKLPPKGSPRATWGKQGAFGVYTAILGGSRTGWQHLHGTIGLPSEKDKFIKNTIIKNGTRTRIGSKGCTRVDNEVIMLFRNFLPVGTPIFKIYAKEIGTTVSPIEYNSWKYVLYSGDDLDELHPLNQEHASSLSPKLIIEKGEMRFKASPSVITLAEPNDRGTDLATNPYNIPLETLGSFNVNTGQIQANYAPPSGLPRGGAEFPHYFWEDAGPAATNKKLIEIME